MDEVKFVLKGLVVAVLVTLALQIKVGGETLEVRSDRLLRQSSVGNFLTQAASGAALAIQKGTQVVTNFVSGTIGTSKNESSQKKTWKIETRHKAVEPRAETSEEESEDSSYF